MPNNSTELEDLQIEYLKTHRQFLIAGITSLGVLLTGVIFYHGVEHLRWIDALYFSTITLTTVGYGDIVPTTDLAKLFTVFYVLIGIGIIAFFANALVKNAVIKRQLKNSKKRSD